MIRGAVRAVAAAVLPRIGVRVKGVTAAIRGLSLALEALAAVVILAAVALVAGALVSLATGAPLPASRGLRPADLAGRWVMTWPPDGSEWDLTLALSGECVATRGGWGCWTGTWLLAGEVLAVCEVEHHDLLRPPPAGAVRLSWRVRLMRDARGRLDVRDLRGVMTLQGASYPFRLRRVP